MLYSLARSALFKLDPEVAHDLSLKSLAAIGPGAALLGAGADEGPPVRVMGIDFPNPVGLAAGLDKSLVNVTSLGESDPLVPTANGIAEPRNRRVEIVVYPRQQ